MGKFNLILFFILWSQQSLGAAAAASSISAVDTGELRGLVPHKTILVNYERMPDGTSSASVAHEKVRMREFLGAAEYIKKSGKVSVLDMRGAEARPLHIMQLLKMYRRDPFIKVIDLRSPEISVDFYESDAIGLKDFFKVRRRKRILLELRKRVLFEMRKHIPFETRKYILFGGHKHIPFEVRKHIPYESRKHILVDLCKHILFELREHMPFELRIRHFSRKSARNISKGLPDDALINTVCIELQKNPGFSVVIEDVPKDIKRKISEAQHATAHGRGCLMTDVSAMARKIQGREFDQRRRGAGLSAFVRIDSYRDDGGGAATAAVTEEETMRQEDATQDQEDDPQNQGPDTDRSIAGFFPSIP